jgi:hypothetical protein
MPIASKAIVEQTQRKSGGYRVKLEYVFSDGRKVTIGPISVPSLAEANASLSLREPSVLKQMQARDAEEAVRLGLSSDHKEAAKKDVYRAWLWEGYYEKESRIAYKILKVIAAKVIALGWSVAEMAVQFETDEETVQEILDRWQYLNANKDVIEAYESVKQGDS